MKTVIKTSIGGPFLRPYFILTAIALGLLALSPGMQAVSPPPDGGYPGQNTAEGQSALLHLGAGTYNTALGWASLGFNVTGNFNTAVGAATLLNNTSDRNTATGGGALLSNSTGDENTANGAFALFNNTNGFDNTAVGDSALHDNTAGNVNTAVGLGALFNNTTGSGNIALGNNAGSNLTTGDNNIYLGSLGVATESNTIRIGTSGTQTSAFIRGIRGVTTGNNDAIPVLIDSAGQLGTTSSSRRFKKEIKPMNTASEAILALKPVTFHYKSDKTNTPQFGLIAEEVAEVNPDLVVHDENGEIYTVRYDAVNAMLLNEFLKEHKKVDELNSKAAKQDATITELKSMVARQEAMIVRQQKATEAFTLQLKEQDAKLQKVSAQVQTNKPAPQMAVNP